MLELIKKIDKECGTPFYLVYPERFVNNLQNFRKAFTDIYPNFILSYSFKTNYTFHFVLFVQNKLHVNFTATSQKY